MKMKHGRALGFLLAFICTLVIGIGICLLTQAAFGADPAPASTPQPPASVPFQWWFPFLPFVAPAITAAIKAWAMYYGRKVPTWLRPLICLFSGPVIDLILSYATSRAANPFVAASLSGLGIGLREAVDQYRKGNRAPAEVPHGAGQLLCLLVAFVLFVPSAPAQMDTNAPPVLRDTTPAVTNAPATTNSFQNAVVDIFRNLTGGGTNWLFDLHALYAPDVQEHWGGGLDVMYPLTQYIYTGAGVEWVNGGFWGFSGNMSLQVPFRPFKWLEITPLARVGVLLPLSGAQVGGYTIPGTPNLDMDPQVLYGYGAMIGIWTSAKGNVSVKAKYEHEEVGKLGRMEMFGAVLTVSF